MRVYKIALVVTVLACLDAASSGLLTRCTTNFACPNGSECVDGYCAVCAIEHANCLRSVERCKQLNCLDDEGCYVSEQQSGNSVTLTLVCAKNNPCLSTDCQEGHCYNIKIGYQPPVAHCRPNTLPNACRELTCPNATRCLVRAGLCAGYPCLLEGVCVPSTYCTSCNYFTQYCEVTVRDNTVNGTCSNLWGSLFHHRWN